MFPPPCLRSSWGHRQHSSSSKHDELSWCQRAGFCSHLTHNTFTQFSSESLANFRQACTVLSWAGGPRGRCRISVLHNVVLPIVFLVTIVPAALRSLTRSPHVVLGWFLTILMIIETPRGEILHLAAWRWSCSPIQPSPPPPEESSTSSFLVKQTFCSFFNLISSSQQNKLLQSIIIYSYIYNI